MNIAEQLNAKGATPETILEIMKTSVFEISGDESADEMKSELRNAAGNPEDVDRALDELASKPDLVRDIALLWIAQAASDPDTADVIEGAIAAADRKAPILEIGAITLVALYAIYRFSPDKPRKVRKITYNCDGTFEELDADFDGFEAPLKGLLRIFSQGGGKA